jgi:hypothetical protein
MDCRSVQTVTAQETRVFGRTIPSRMKTVVLRAGTAPTVRWTMVDQRGCSIDLTPCIIPTELTGTIPDPPAPDDPNLPTIPTPPSAAQPARDLAPAGIVPVYLRIIENTLLGFDPDFAGRAIDIPNGVVEADLDLRRVGGPGIYVAEFAVLGADLETVLVANQFTVWVERGLFAGDPTGIPTLAEIRLLLRDSPQHNELLGEYAWDISEIVQALQAPVDFWNAALPDIGVYYTTQTWPPQFRYWWIRGTIATLFRIAAEGQRRNQFDYSAGGIQVQDSQRSQDYLQAAEMEWQAFTQWVQSRKIAMNNELCWGEVYSGYRHA